MPQVPLAEHNDMVETFRADGADQALRIAFTQKSGTPVGFCYSPIPLIPRNAGWDIGPLMIGAREGDASGAGIRLSNAGICGAGF